MEGLWGQIFILDSPIFNRRLPLTPGFFREKRRNICTATLRISDWNISILRKLVNRNFQKLPERNSQRSGPLITPTSDYGQLYSGIEDYESEELAPRSIVGTQCGC